MLGCSDVRRWLGFSWLLLLNGYCGRLCDEERIAASISSVLLAISCLLPGRGTLRLHRRARWTLLRWLLWTLCDLRLILALHVSLKRAILNELVCTMVDVLDLIDLFKEVGHVGRIKWVAS